jgi:glycerate 2-kinase
MYSSSAHHPSTGKNEPAWKDHPAAIINLIAAALEAADPYQAVKNFLKLGDGSLWVGEHEIVLDKGNKIFVIGAGKAAVAMACAVEDVLTPLDYQGILAIPTPPSDKLRQIDFVVGGHPIPNSGSLQAGEQVAAMLKSSSAGDLVLVLISGGGSALFELLQPGLDLDDLQKTTDLLLKCGAPIQEINIVRKQLSQIKGGGLLQLASPARVAALILSDVVGDDLGVIASGPTVKETSRPLAAMPVLEKYDLLDAVPKVVQAALKRIPENVLSAIPIPEPINQLVGSNILAARACENTAKSMGFNASILSHNIEGEAREVARQVSTVGKSVRRSKHRLEAPACLVYGGETTVTIQGKGTGGRNQELALAAAIELEDWDRIALVSFATDGIDGVVNAAGAIARGTTLTRAAAKGMNAAEFLKENNSYPFFKALDDLIITGPTGTNVNDLVLCLVYPKAILQD